MCVGDGREEIGRQHWLAVPEGFRLGHKGGLGGARFERHPFAGRPVHRVVHADAPVRQLFGRRLFLGGHCGGGRRGLQVQLHRRRRGVRAVLLYLVLEAAHGGRLQHARRSCGTQRAPVQPRAHAGGR